MVSLLQISKWLEAEVIAGEDGLHRRVELVCSCDLMSDVLAYSHAGSLLLTGLVNAQVVHTCEVAGIFGVVFVRGKRPAVEVAASAKEFGISMLTTRLSMFEACGILFTRGLKGFNGNGIEGVK